ncbi:hypothetical protein Tco_1352604, partial [Tanacetum coccineum]
APADRHEFGKCNMRLKTDIKPKEATFQVVMDALALTPFYRAFLITADVPAIYMQEFWATISIHKPSMRFTKRRKSSKDVESSRDSRSKEKKSSSTSKDASQSQHKHSGKSAHAEEPSHTIDDSGVKQDQEFDKGNNDEQPTDKEVTKDDWFKKPKRPTTHDFDWNKRQHVDSRPPQTWISQVARAKEPRTSFDELMDTSFDFFAFVLNWLNIKDLTQEILVGPAFELLKDHRGRQIIPQDFFINNNLEYLKGVDLSRRYSTSVTNTKAATYEIKWIEDLGPKRQHFYEFAANMTSSKDVYSRKRIIAVTRLSIMEKYDYGHLEEIEKLTNLTIDERYALNVALRVFTRRIVIQRRVEDLQLGVESYQKKLNLTKPDTFRSNEHKEIDGTLNDVRSALNDIAKGIRMECLPKRKWSGLDKRRARVMIQDIDKQLYKKRLMRNLEKFVGGREYGNDLRLLERTI